MATEATLWRDSRGLGDRYVFRAREAGWYQLLVDTHLGCLGDDVARYWSTRLQVDGPRQARRTINYTFPLSGPWGLTQGNNAVLVPDLMTADGTLGYSYPEQMRAMVSVQLWLDEYDVVRSSGDLVEVHYLGRDAVLMQPMVMTHNGRVMP